MVETSVTYHDDGAKTARTVNEEWDGLGSFRKVTEYGFGGEAYRVTRQDSNCDRRQSNGACLLFDVSWQLRCDTQDPNYNCPLSPAHWSNWVLGTKSYSQVEDAEGHVLQRTEFSYDPEDGDPNNDLGYLRASKQLLTIPQGVDLSALAGNPATGTAGDVKTEFTYEGDPACPSGSGSYRTGNLCKKKVTDYGATSGVFEESYTYQHGAYLATRKVLGLNPIAAWLAEDRDIDQATGLTRVTRDPNGVATTLGYDPLGRLTSVTPDAKNGTESAATLSYPDIWTTTLEQKISDTDKIYSKFTFDRLGRLIQVDKRQADASLAVQKTAYDIAGRVTFQSEWGDPNRGTTFDYTDPASDPENPTADPFGRVRKTTTADSKVTWTDYFGVSSAVTVEGIKASLDPNIPTLEARTVYEKDAFGRLTSVLTDRTYPPSGPALAAGADAYYGYDRLDRLLSVRLDSQDPNTLLFVPQYRSFAYNALGQQTSATNPENGSVLNVLYDAAGNLTKRQDAAGNLFEYEYDAASRLLSQYVTKPGQSRQRVLLNTYDEYGPALGYGLGHLTTQVSYDESGRGLLQQHWRYNGLNGRLSETAWRVGAWWGDPNASLASQPELSMSTAYNALGLASSVTYPNRDMLGPPTLSLQMTYASGFLVGVSDPFRGALVESIAYNPAGGVSLIRTKGGVETSIVPDVRNRPSSITITKQAATPVTHFASGAYAYDGAGNITAIGTDRFAYDALSRLVEANVTDPTIAGKYEHMNWSYDPLGNMTMQRRETHSPMLGTTPVATAWFKMDIDPNSQPLPNKNQIRFYGVTGENGPPSESGFVPQYDANGNLTLDRSFAYVFDARNRLSEVRNPSNGALVARYTYDASGNRLSKFEADTGTTTFYVRDASGQVVSEYRRPDVPGRYAGWLKDYVYAAGRHVAMMENEAPSVPGGITVGTFHPFEEEDIYNVKLTWEATGDLDLAGYDVNRSGGGSPSTTAFVGAAFQWYRDWQVTAGQTYTYIIRAVDQANKVSGWSEPVVVTVNDQTPPAAPVTGAIAPGDQKVDLSWTAPADADLWSFQFYRKLSSEATYQALGPALHKSQTHYTDVTVTNDVTYDYQITAFDTSGLASAAVPAATGVWRAMPTDTTPPDVPQGFYADAGATSVSLFWRASTAPDFEKYQLFRSNSPIGSTPQGSPLVQPTVPQATDAVLNPRTRYYYRVRAVDHKGNLSALSEQLIVDTKDDLLPKPTALSVVRWGYDDEIGIPDARLPYNTTPLPGSVDPKGYFSYENDRGTTIRWSAGASGATLEGFRIYGRRRTDEPWQVWRELPANPNCYGLPIGYEYPYPLTPVCHDPNYSGGDAYLHADFAFDPQDRCQNTFLRASAIGTINGTTRESELTVATTTQPPVLTRPENLQVPEEAFDSNSPALRLDPAYYGLTLSWTPGASFCGGIPVGYHVYRNRLGATGPIIRLTKFNVPLQTTSMRMEYLPLVGPNAANHSGCPTAPAFPDGPVGYHSGGGCVGDDCPFVYAVTSVDALGCGFRTIMNGRFG